MSKKTIDDVMALNYSDENEKRILMNCLRKIKPFSKYSDDVEIPMDMVELYVNKVVSKYEIRIGYVFYTLAKTDGCLWTLMLREKVSGTYLDTIYASSMYGLMVKTAIRLNYAIKNQEIRERTRKADII